MLSGQVETTRYPRNPLDVLAQQIVAMGAMDPNPYETLIPQHPNLGPMLMNLFPVEITEPVDQSNAVLFLASDESRYITSISLPVDAGASHF